MYNSFLAARLEDAKRDLEMAEDDEVLKRLHRVQVLKEVMRLPQKIITTR